MLVIVYTESIEWIFAKMIFPLQLLLPCPNLVHRLGQSSNSLEVILTGVDPLYLHILLTNTYMYGTGCMDKGCSKNNFTYS